jgi:hypothetical protein
MANPNWISHRKTAAEYEKQRKQNKKITIRMTTEQYDEFQKQIALAKMNQNAFVLKSISNIPINVIDGVIEIHQELKHIGRNINQLAKLCNSDKTTPDSAAVEELTEEVQKIWRQLQQLRAEHP